MPSRRYQAILLPGAVMPAALAYADLVRALGDDVDARPKELELYAGDAPPAGWSLATEVAGVLRTADAAGFDRFHVVGYSGGGAVALAFCAAYPHRLRTLTLNEPAWAGNKGLSELEQERWREYARIESLPPAEMIPAFMRAQLKDGVELPPPPTGDPPPWMQSRPAGIKAFLDEFKKSDLDIERLREFQGPVLCMLGARSHPGQFAEIAARLANVFRDFRVEVFAERHHFDPPHRVEFQRVAELLRAHWDHNNL